MKKKPCDFSAKGQPKDTGFFLFYIRNLDAK